MNQYHQSGDILDAFTKGAKHAQFIFESKFFDRAGSPGSYSAKYEWDNMDFYVTGESPVEQEVATYITFFNTARPAYSLKYLTPQQYKDAYAPKDFAIGVSAGG